MPDPCCFFSLLSHLRSMCISQSPGLGQVFTQMVDEKYFDDGSIYRDVGRAKVVHKAPGEQPQGGQVAEPRQISGMEEGAQHGLHR